MPAAVLARREQEIDRRKRRALDVAIERPHAMRGAEHLDVMPALGMLAHAERVQQLNGA